MWDDGVDGTLLCHLLFSVHEHDPAEGAAMLRFRCGPVHGQHGTKTNYCHKLNYRGLRDVAQSTCRAEREESELAQEGRDAAKPGDAHRARWAARWASCVWPLAWGCAAEPVMPRCDCVLGGGGDRHGAWR